MVTWFTRFIYISCSCWCNIILWWNLNLCGGFSLRPNPIPSRNDLVIPQDATSTASYLFFFPFFAWNCIRGITDLISEARSRLLFVLIILQQAFNAQREQTPKYTRDRWRQVWVCSFKRRNTTRRVTQQCFTDDSRRRSCGGVSALTC